MAEYEIQILFTQDAISYGQKANQTIRLVTSHTVFPMWCGCSGFVLVISCPYNFLQSFLESCYNKMLGIPAEICSAHN